MSRPYSWYPLASSDPVPGDPAVVRAGGDHYRAVATAIGDAERVLRALVDAQDAVSEAVDAVSDRMRAVADRIRQAHQRYDAAAAALVGYSAQLDLAQRESLEALRSAQGTQRSLDIADDAVRRWTTLLDEATDDGEDTTTQRRALTAAREERSDAELALVSARRQLADAVARRDEAAQRAMDGLTAGTDDGLHDGWWEDWGADVAQVVSTWAGNIATGAGLLSLVLGWVPVLGQVLMVVALVASAAALAADLALAIKRGDGQDWFNVVMGVVGLATFGAGRALAGAVDAFGVSARTATSQAATKTAGSLIRRLPRGASGSPAARGSAEATMDGLKASTSAVGQVRVAWDQVMSLHGADRVLALAGHGELVTQNNALRTQLWDAFPFRPLTFLTLLGPTVRGAALEGGAAVLYTGDAVLGVSTAVRSVVDQASGSAPAARARLAL